jgi:hypothetical protein
MPRREGEVFRLGTAIFGTPANQAATGGLAEREKGREARLIHANARERQPCGERKRTGNTPGVMAGLTRPSRRYRRRKLKVTRPQRPSPGVAASMAGSSPAMTAIRDKTHYV